LFVLVMGVEFYRSAHQRGHPGRIDWLFVTVVTSGLVGLLVMLIERVRARPSPEQRAALSAIFRSGPGTIGAVVVTRNGVPEVIATVKSKEEYLQLVGSGQLPHDHHVYLPSDV
jgi:hypothetical protein